MLSTFAYLPLKYRLSHFLASFIFFKFSMQGFHNLCIYKAKEEEEGGNR